MLKWIIVLFFSGICMSRANLPENAAVGVVTFIWLKVKGPKYVLPAFLARPAYVHLEATADWLHQCY